MEAGKKAVRDGRGNRFIDPPTEKELEMYQAIIKGYETTFSASRKMGKGYANFALVMWHIALKELRKAN